MASGTGSHGFRLKHWTQAAASGLVLTTDLYKVGSDSFQREKSISQKVKKQIKRDYTQSQKQSLYTLS